MRVVPKGVEQVKFKSQVFTETSGSIGGVTYSHNRGGMYTRARAVPVNPNSPEQQLVRSIVANLTSLWNDVLTAGQRTGWNTYAANVLIPDRLGEPRNIGGLGQYVRSNVSAIQALGATARVDDAPSLFNLGGFTMPTLAVAAPSDLVVSFDVTDGWYTSGGRMFLYSSRPQNPTINYFKGPYRLAGNVVQPDASPKILTAPFTFAAGQRVFVFGRVWRTSGRLTLPFYMTADA